MLSGRIGRAWGGRAAAAWAIWGCVVAAAGHEGHDDPRPAQAPAAPTGQARGFVFEDLNRNGKRDEGEPGIPGVRVCNGLDIVYTRSDGAYELPVGDDTILFVIKPADWMTPVDEHKLPKFHYIHKPAGSPPLKYKGVAPTGPLPASVDFPLHRRPEASKFQALIFGDTQPRNQREIDYMAHDVIEPLIGSPALLGVTLGDVVFDDLSLFGSLNATVGKIGIPWYNVLGNHDMNYDAADDRHSDETFERVYGPPYYSFDVGKVHFVVLDNVAWIAKTADKDAHYVSGLGDRQMQWLVNDLKLATPDQLIVLMMHIPLRETKETAAIFAELARFPYTLSLSAHAHFQEHVFFTDKEGWTRAEPHHHVICATVCGSWWGGLKDENGIPHATMSDGAPNGHNLITFDAAQYTIEFRAARRPAEHQMNIYAPEVIAAADAGKTLVTANVFSGNEKTRVQMRVGDGAWAEMTQTTAADPTFVEAVAVEAAVQPPPEHKLPKPTRTPHLWTAAMPGALSKGTHVIEIRATDMFGLTHTGRRFIRVE